MRYILFTFVGPERVADWEAMTAAEKEADIERHRAWFREHGSQGRIKGGEELGSPAAARTVRLKGITDGPFVETKELLGGFIIVEVPDEATALEMARTWPGMVHDSDRVEVWPVGSSEEDATATARRSARADREGAPDTEQPAGQMPPAVDESSTDRRGGSNAGSAVVRHPAV